MNRGRVRAGVAAVVLGFLMLVAPGSATAAAAADRFGQTLAAPLPTVALPNPSQIRGDATGSITVHDHPAPPPNGADPGSEGAGQRSSAGTSRKPGVVFTIARVEGVDLLTSAGWDLARSYLSGPSGLAAARAHAGTPVTAAPTSDGGTTRIVGLPLGLYLIHETTADPLVVPTEDFLVTIPRPDPTGGSWLYDLEVYPKRAFLGITKSVADGNAGVSNEDSPVAGRVLTYSLLADVPAVGLLDSDSVYEIHDDLATNPIPGSNPAATAADYLAYATPGWEGLVTVAVGARSLTECSSAAPSGCDYTLTRSATAVGIEMTAQGRARLAAALDESPRPQVHVTIQAIVLGRVEGVVAGSVIDIPNVAHLIPSAEAKAEGSSIPSNEVRTRFGTLVVHKVNAVTGNSLAGAQFTLYRTRADAEQAHDPLAVSTVTGADGVGTFAGVHVTDYQNDATDDDSYWIVETLIPNGFVPSTNPIRIRLLSNGATAEADLTGGLRVPNPPRPPGTLSFTGADVGWLLALGVGLLVAGGAALVVTGRRREDLQLT